MSEGSDEGTVKRLELVFPDATFAARVAALVALIDRQRRAHGTPPHELTNIDRAALASRGFTEDEIAEASRVQHAWERTALAWFGRIGRDPDRITPLLTEVGRVWRSRSALSFGRLFLAVARSAWGDREPALPEDAAWMEALASWDAANPTMTPASAEATRHIDAFLERLERAWRTNADLRFGQLVSNPIRVRLSIEALSWISDERFLEFLALADT